MPIASKRPSLAAAAREFLTSEFEAIGRSSRSSLRARADRVAVTFRPRIQGRDAISDGFIPAEKLLLIAISYRRREGAWRGPSWRATLGVHAPILQFPGSGRVAFRRERAFDLMDSRDLIRRGPNFTAMRSAVVLDHAARDADDADIAAGLNLPAFYFGFDARRPPRIAPADLHAAGAAERIIDGLRAWPAALFRRDGRSTLDRRPERVFASMAMLKGRRIRNPAFAVLGRHGLLPADVGYKHWRSSVSSLMAGQGRVFQDPRSEGTEASRLRRAIQDYVLADPAREPRILADLAQACRAVGIVFDEGPDGADALAALLDNPWDRPSVADAAAIQVVKLTRPAAMHFDDGASVVDLADLGAEGKPRLAPAAGR